MIIRNREGTRISTVCDWFKHAPPKQGEAHWKDGRSAKELAKAWLRPAVPAELQALFSTSPTFTAFTAEEALPEYEIRLDDFRGEARNADLLILGRIDQNCAIVTVEAKADEPFAELIGEYHDRHIGTRSNIPARIAALSEAMFGRGLDGDVKALRYQLLHAPAATLIEAKERGARYAAFVVHEFRSAATSPAKLAANADDWARFLNVLYPQAGNVLHSGTLIGPIHVPGGKFVPKGIPLFVGKIVSAA